MNEQMKKMWLVLRRNYFLRMGILWALLVLFALFFLIPNYRKNKEIAREVGLIYADNQQTQSHILSSGHSGQKLESIQNLLNKYQQMIPPRAELSDVLDKVASRAQAHGLEVQSLKPLRNVPFPGDTVGILKSNREQIYEVMINMKAKGHFMEVGRYVNDLEEAPFKMIIKNIKLETPNFADNELREPELSVDMVLSILMVFSGEESIL